MSLLYRLDCSSSGLAVRLEEKNSRRILYLDTLKSLARPEDKEALDLLVKLHLRSGKTPQSLDTLSFQKIEIGQDQAISVLEKISKTSRLYYKTTCLQSDWKNSAKLYWKEEKGAFFAVLQWKAQEILLSCCDFVGHGWCLWQGHIFSFQSNVSWKWIESFIQKPVVLMGAEKKKFLDEEPPILWEKKEEEKPLEILPELYLTDATGSFANLKMHYVGFGRIGFNDFSLSIESEKIARQKEVEVSWEKDLLETGFIKKTVGNSSYYCPQDKVKETIFFLLDLGWKVFDFLGRQVLRQKQIAYSVVEENQKMAITAEVSFADRKISLRSLIASKNSWVDLGDGIVGFFDRTPFVSLEGEWEQDKLILSKAAFVSCPLFSNVYQNNLKNQFLAASVLPSNSHAHSCLASQQWSLAPHANLKEPPCQIPDSSGYFGIEVNWSGHVRQMMRQVNLTEEIPEALVSESFQGKLIPYQQKGVNFLSFLQKWGFSCLLADEMGLGKTVQVLAFFSRLGTNLPLLVVAPSSLLYQWEMEISRFLPKMSVYVHSGPDRRKCLQGIVGVVVTSYSMVRLDLDLFSSLEFEVIVLDEAQAIKTQSTQTARSVRQLKGRFRISLTGTPIENRAEELVSQFQFLMPDLVTTSDLMSLKRKTKPFILRRKKQDVELELPEKIEQISWIEMTEDQKALYNSVQSQFQTGLRKKIQEDGVGKHRMEVLEAILRLRQICVDPRLVGEAIAGSKLELLLSDIEDRKVLVFSQFTSMLHLVQKALENVGRPYLYLDGSTSNEERALNVRRFQEDATMNVFLLSLKAGGVGLNLTKADYVILLDPWWNEAVENQAIDRAHRIGQKNVVIAKKYLIPNSIEEKMLRLKKKKTKTAELLLEDAGSSWTEEDLLHLLF